LLSWDQPREECRHADSKCQFNRRTRPLRACKVESGRYENASEVVRAALRTLEREEQQYEAELAALRAAIDEGDASGIAKGKVFERVRKKLNLPLTRR